MNQNRENLHSNGDGERKTRRIDPESKVKSWPEKLTLPSIRSTVIQEPPSVQQELPRLQPVEKLNLPKIQSKERKAPATPRSAGKRILPSIPTVGELSLPSIQSKASTSMAHNLSIPPTTEEKAKPSAPNPQVKEPPMDKSAVGRMLPNIPSLEDLDLQSIEPTVVIVRPRRLLPILPTIIEQTSPMPSEEDATEEGVHSAINDVSQSLETKEKESSLPSAPSIAKQAQTSLQSIKKEAFPCGTEKLKKKASKNRSERPRKLSKGTQTVLQLVEVEVMPSLNSTNKERLLKIPGKTVEHSLQKAPTVTSSKENPIVKDERDPEHPVNETVSGMKPPATESSPSPQPTLEQALPRPPITTRKARPESVPPLNLDQLCPKSPPARRMKLRPQTKDVEPLGNIQRAARQTQTKAEAKRLVPALHSEQIGPKSPAARRMKSSLKATHVVDGTVRQTQTKAEPKRLVPPLNSERISPKPPEARRTKLSHKASDVEPLGSIKGEVRQTQTKAEPKQLVQRHNLDSISPRSSADRRIKLSPQTSGKPLTKVQRAARQTQTKAEGLFIPQQTLEHKVQKPPAARRMKLSSQTTREILRNSKGTVSQTKTEALLSPQFTTEHNFPRPPATKPCKVGPQATEGGPLKSVPGTLPNTLTKSETLSNPQHTLDHNLPRPATARPTKASSCMTDTEEVPSLPSKKKEAPPNEQPKPGTYAFLNLKRREFEALQRLELIAKQCRANGQPVGRYSRHHLTLNSVLPEIHTATEEAKLLKPHRPAENFTKKGLPSTRQTVKQPHPKVRATFDRELTNHQPTVKQALPSIISSNPHTLVKQPLPSIEPDEKSNVQPTVKETERSSQSGH